MGRIKINIVIVHNYYQQPGGEDQVVLQEKQMLIKNGHKVTLYSEHNDTINETNILGKIRLFINTIWSKNSYKKFKEFLEINKPDVVHFHNFFPLISPSAYYACKRLGVPVVQTLHNYRIICPGATFLKKEEVCEKCLKGSKLNSIVHACYRDSTIQTTAVSLMIIINRLINTWNKQIDKYIVLTKFAESKFIETGISQEKIIVKPNFLAKDNKLTYEKENYILYVGRISKEKGVHILLNAWEKYQYNNEIKLLIIGDGPEKNELEQYSSKLKNVFFLGKKSSLEVLNFMKKAKFLVVPSIWYEGFPMTIVESLSVGTPILCSKIGSLQEVVTHGETGFHFEPNNSCSLVRVLDSAIKTKKYNMLVEKAFNEFNNKYSESENYKQLIKIYSEIIERNKNENSIRIYNKIKN